MLSARKADNPTEVSMIRSIISAIENAQAVETEDAAEPKIGLGHDRPRRELTSEDVKAVLTREHDEVNSALDEYEALGLPAQVEEFEIRRHVIERYLDAGPS